MGSFRRYRAFDPHDLELIDAAYEAAWKKFVLRHPFRDTSRDTDGKMFLRKRMFAMICGVIDPEALSDEVLASLPLPPAPQNEAADCAESQQLWLNVKSKSKPDSGCLF
jgi:hypothetical protein